MPMPLFIFWLAVPFVKDEITQCSATVDSFAGSSGVEEARGGACGFVCRDLLIV